MHEAASSAGQVSRGDSLRRDGYGFHAFPVESPCARDPVIFECNDCPIGFVMDCQLRGDPDRRSLHAARYRRMAGWLDLTPKDAEDISGRTLDASRDGGLDVPPAAAGSERRLAQAVWSMDPRISITAGGYARVRSRDALPSSAFRRLWDEPAGIPFLREALAAAAAAAGENQPRLMELCALAAHLGLRRPLRDSAPTPDTLFDATERLRKAEGWSFADMVRLAYGHEVPILSADVELLALRRVVLLATRAEGFADKSEDQLRMRHETLRQILILANLPLAIDQVFRARSGYWPYLSSVGASALDLMQESVFGLTKSVDRFDPVRGVAFATYAVPWIRAGVDRWYKDHRYTNRLPVHRHDALGPFLEAWDRLKASTEPVVEVSALRALLEEDPYVPLNGDAAATAADALAVADPLSLEMLTTAELKYADAGCGDGVKSLPEMGFPVEGIRASEDQIVREGLRADMIRVLSILPAIQREVLARRSGWDPLSAFDDTEDRGETLQSIGDSLGLTRERIRQLEAKAVRTLLSSQNASWFRARWDTRR